SPRRPFVATSQMRGDGSEYKPAGMTGHKFFEIGLTGAAALGVAKMNACRLGRRAGGESPHPAGTEAAANDLVGGAATTSLSVRHGRTRSGHPDACTRCADSSAGSADQSRIKSGDADDGTERLDDRPEEPG